MSKLTLEQELFCTEFMVDFNPSGAFLRSGLECKKSLEEDAIELMESPSIKQRIEELYIKLIYEDARQKRKIIEELEAIAFADLSSGEPISIKEKLSALSDLAKVSGLMNDFNFAIKTLRKYGFALVPTGRHTFGLEWELQNKKTLNL